MWKPNLFTQATSDWQKYWESVKLFICNRNLHFVYRSVRNDRVGSCLYMKSFIYTRATVRSAFLSHDNEKTTHVCFIIIFALAHDWQTK